MKKNVVCVKIGGSLLFKDGEIDVPYLRHLGQVIKDLSENFMICVVVGGGSIAKKYISAARQLGASEGSCDIMGIETARNNARLLIMVLGKDCYPSPPNSFDKAIEALSTGKIVIFGGFQPGQSTNAVAASIAEYTRANMLINATDVDGVYDSDPQKDPKAKKFPKMTVDGLIKLINTQSQKAGEYPLFDIVAAQIVKRGNIKLVFLDGKNPENIKRAAKGEEIGTLVTATEE